MLLLSTATATTTVAFPSAYVHQLYTTPPFAFPPSSALHFQTKFWPCKPPLSSCLPLPQTRRFGTADRSTGDDSDDRFTGDRSDEEGPWSLDAELDKVLMGEESQALLKDLKAAAERVAAAKRELEDLEKLEKSQGIGETRMQRLDAADSTVAECQREVFAAEAAVKMAEIALVKARAGSSVREISEKWEKEGIDEERERVESGKAASVSALVGTLASLPWSVAMVGDTGLELFVNSGLVFTSCALFGITFRYAVRRNLGNTQLKAGCAAAFALVRGLGQIDAPKLLSGLPEGAVQKLLTVCTILGESFVVFFFAAVALDYCFRQGYVSPFPSTTE